MEKKHRHALPTRLIAVVLTFAMIVSVLTGVMPGTGMATHAETEYTSVSTFDELTAAISSGKNVKLTADIEVTSEITSSGSIIIDGAGKKLTGGGESRFFKVNGILVLKDVTVSGFSARGGGAVSNSGTLVLDHCIFSGNSSNYSGAGGGAIENKGKLYATGTTFSENYSGEIGGAINNYNGSLYLTNCTFTNNYTTATGEAYGGAIGNNNTSRDVRIINCTFTGNYYANVTSKRSDFGVFQTPTNYTIAGCDGIVITPSSSGLNTVQYGAAILDYSDLSNIQFDYASSTIGVYTLVVTGGANATSTGKTTQIQAAATDIDQITFTADANYTFPAFEMPDQNGISVTRTSDTVVTISGTMTADTEIVVPDAADLSATAPTISAVTAPELAYGYTEGSVSVTATAAEGHTLSYQWYSNTSNSNVGGTEISGATDASYDIPTGKATGTEEYYYCVVTATRDSDSQTATATSDAVKVEVSKADPTAVVPEATATYGQTLADVTLTNPDGNTAGTWAWVDAATTGVGAAGNNTFKANFTPNDAANYNGKTNVDVTIAVSKADPTVAAPTGLTAIYGQTLADVTLTNPEGNTPGTWAWTDETAKVGNVGTNTFTAVFTPTDTDNYNSVSGVEVTVTVSQADPVALAPSGEAYYGQNLANVALTNPNGNTPGTWAWVDAGTTSVGSEGTNTFKANFTPTDTTNYNSVLNVDVQVTVTIDPVDKAAVDAVNAKIDALPMPDNVAITNAAAINEAKAAYTALTALQKTLISAESVAKLTDCETKLVKAYIADLTEPANVKVADKTAIETARAAFDALSMTQKSQITSAESKKLQDAEKVLAFELYKPGLKNTASDMAKEGDSEACKTLIADAKTAIDDLAYDFTKTPEANKEAENAIIDALMSDLDTQRAADAVLDLIAAIPKQITKETAEEKIQAARAAYDKLKDAQKALVDEVSLTKLTDSETVLAVAAEIEALPTAEDVKDTDVKAIHEAREVFDALSITQKAMLDGALRSKLQDCEEALISDVTDSIVDFTEITDENIAEVKDLLDSYDALTDEEKAAVNEKIGKEGKKKLADLEKAYEVAERISELKDAKDITAADANDVSLVRTAYGLLSKSQQALISEGTLAKLGAAEAKLEELKEADELAAARADAIKRLEDYAQAKALADADTNEKAAYDKAVDGGKTAINAATTEGTIESALTDAKAAVDAALKKINDDRAAAAAAEAEMAAADEALEGANMAAALSKAAAEEAAEDKYASEADKKAINEATTALDAAVKAANELSNEATAEQKNKAAADILAAASDLDAAVLTAVVNSAAAAQLATAKVTAVGRLEDYSEAKALTDATPDEKKAYEDVVADEITKINAAETPEAAAAALTAAKKAVDDKLAEILQARADAAEMAEADEALADAKAAAEEAVKAADAALKDTYVPAADQTAINAAKSTLATALDAANALKDDATAEQKNTAAKNVMDAVKALTEATDKANVDSAVAQLEEATAAEQLKAAKETAVDRLTDYSEAKALSDATPDEKKAYDDVVADEITKINAAETPEAAAAALTAAKKAVDDKLAEILQARAEAVAVEAAAAQLAAAKETAVGRLEDYSEAKALTDATPDEKKAYEDVVADEIDKINAAETPEAAVAALTAAKKAVDDKLAEILQARADAAEMAAADEALADAKAAAEEAIKAAEAALKDTYVPAADQTAINAAKSTLATALDAANALKDDATAEQKNTAAKNVMDAVKALTEATDKANVDSAVAQLEEATAAEQLKAAKETAVGRLEDYSEAKALSDATQAEKKAYDDVVAAEIAKINAAETPEAAAAALTAAKKAVDDKLAEIQQARAEAAAVEAAAAQLAAAKETAVGRLEDYSEAKALTDATPDEKKAYEEVVAAEIAKINAAETPEAAVAALTAAKKAVDDKLAEILQARADAAAAAELMAEADQALEDANMAATMSKAAAEAAAEDKYASEADKKAINEAMTALNAAIKAADELSKEATAEQKNKAAADILSASQDLDAAVLTAVVNSAAAAQLAAAKDTATARLTDYSEAKALADATADEKAAYDRAVADGKAAIEAAKDAEEVAQALSDAKAAVDDALAKINADRAAAAAAAAEMAEADETLAAAEALAALVKAEAETAAEDEYASATDKQAISDAAKTLDEAVKAANELPSTATAADKKAAADAIVKAAVDLGAATDAAEVNSAAAKAAAEAEADAAAQLAAAKATASDRLDDYSEAKALADATPEEKAAYDQAVADGKAAIEAAKDTDAVAKAVTDAKAAVDAALEKINADRAAAAATAEEMAKADQAIEDSLIDALKARLDAIAAKTNEYISEEDLKAVNEADEKLDSALEAMDNLPDNATADEKIIVAEAIRQAAAIVNMQALIADVHSAAAEKTADGLAAAKKSALERLDDYSDAKALEDFTEAEQKEYDEVVAAEKEKINAAEDTDAVAAVLKAAKEAVNAEIAKIKEDRAAAEAATALINGLSATEDITVDDKDSIKAAREAYDALTDDQKAKVSEDTLKKLEDAEATLAVVSKYSNEWVNGKWYNKDAKQTYLGIGKWHKSSKGWWFGDNLGWYAKNQWQKIDGKWYFFDKEGYMETNAYRQGYYLNAKGVWDGKAKVAGWKQDSKGWYYSLGGKNFLKNCWKKIDGKWYYFKANGYAAQNEFVQGWWLNKNCVQSDPVKYSWHKTSKGSWYGVKDGWYAKSKAYTIDGTSYKFDKNGICTTK